MIAVSADIAKVSQTLQVSAAPVFMLAAMTSLLLVLSNRLHYIGERPNLLEHELASLLQQASHDSQVVDQFRSVCKLLHRRINITRDAMAFASLSGLLIALDVGVLFDDTLTQSHVSTFVAVTFMAAMICFQISLLCFLRELLGKHCIAKLGPLQKYIDF